MRNKNKGSRWHKLIEFLNKNRLARVLLKSNGEKKLLIKSSSSRRIEEIPDGNYNILKHRKMIIMTTIMTIMVIAV